LTHGVLKLKLYRPGVTEIIVPVALKIVPAALKNGPNLSIINVTFGGSKMIKNGGSKSGSKIE
jgi:hypothetical protein